MVFHCRQAIGKDYLTPIYATQGIIETQCELSVKVHRVFSSHNHATVSSRPLQFR